MQDGHKSNSRSSLYERYQGIVNSEIERSTPDIHIPSQDALVQVWVLSTHTGAVSLAHLSHNQGSRRAILGKGM